MAEKLELVKIIGSLGLLERLNEEIRNEGLANFPFLINSVRDQKYETTQGIGADFIPDDNLYNAVGAVYPLLDIEQKNDAIKAHLNQLDGINYYYVNRNHTPFIREPLLLTDITIARPLYWPGLHDEEHLWRKKNSFSEIEKEIMTERGLFRADKVKSDFLVAYALMRSDFTRFGGDYIKVANPEFLERVLKGIVALRFAKETSKEEIDKGRNRLCILLPKAIHDKVEDLRQKGDWTNYQDF